MPEPVTLADEVKALAGRNEEPVPTVEVHVAIGKGDPAAWQWCYRITVPKGEFDALADRVQALEDAVERVRETLRTKAFEIYENDDFDEDEKFEVVIVSDIERALTEGTPQ